MLDQEVMSSQIKREIINTVEFNSLLREHTILIPAYDFYNLQDIHLRFYLLPSFQPFLAGQELSPVKDIRLHINEIDYSVFLFSELASTVQKASINDVKAKYNVAATKWINYLASFGGSYPVNADAQKRILKQLLTVPSFDDQFVRNENKDYGYQNGLHILNFLYKDINLPNISLKNVLNLKQAKEKKASTDFTAFDYLKLTFSNGPAPSYEIIEDASKYQPRGRLYYSLVFIYNNPFYDLLQIVANKILDVQQNMEEQRVKYLLPLQDLVQKMQIDTEAKLEAYSNLVDKLAKDVNQKL
jgi:hypothetical protein